MSQSLLTAELAPHGLKIYLRGNTAAAVEFLQSLPEARQVKSQAAWSVDATPAAAWRLVNECPTAVQADDAVLDLSTEFVRSLQAAASCRETTEQPPLRKLGWDLWRHQVAGYHFAAAHAASMLAMEMGTGKSAVAVLLYVNKGCRRGIVVCPKSVLAVWRREFAKHSPVDVDVLVLDRGATSRKRDEAEQFLAVRRHRRCVVVVNYEMAWREEFALWVLRQEWDCAIGDESHRFADPTTKTSKFMAELGKAAKFRLCLTGTPMSTPLSLFGQFRFLDRGIFGSSYSRFRARYAEANPMFPSQVKRYINQEELKERFALIAYRVTMEETDLTLPGVVHNEMRVELNPAAVKIYKTLRDELVAQIGDGVVTGANPLTKTIRLRQIVAGYVVQDGEPDEPRVVHWVDSSKADALRDVLEDIPPDEKIVVFCDYRPELDQVREIAEKLGRVYGEVSGARKDLTDRGEYSPECTMLGVQYQSGGVGIDLTAARYVFFFSPTWSLTNYEQALKRLHRPGQRRTVFAYNLVASGTVDEVVYRALQEKRDVVEAVLEALSRKAVVSV